MYRSIVGMASVFAAALLLFVAAPRLTAQEDAGFRLQRILQAPTPGNEGWFGNSLALDGTHVIVGEPFGDAGSARRAGRAHVFSVAGDLVVSLQSPAPKKEGNFGGEEYCNKLVSAGEGLFAVGETRAQGGGRVYLFNLDGSVLVTLASAETLRGNREFGNAVAMTSELVLVGSYNAGAFLYDRSGARIAVLKGAQGAVQDGFGMATSIAGDTIVVTQDHATVGGVREAGMAHIYNLKGELRRSISAPVPEQASLFGVSAATSGDLIVVGSPGATIDGRARAGSAYLFTADGELKKVLTAPVQALHFGVSVSIDENRIVVGASGTKVDGLNGAGQVFVFDRDGTFRYALQQPKPSVGGNFGWSVASRGTVIAVSAPAEEVDGKIAAGKVYLFEAP